MNVGCQVSIPKFDVSTQTELPQPNTEDQYGDETTDDEIDFQDNEEIDPNYLPEGDGSEEESYIEATQSNEPHKELKFLVSKSSLLDLFTYCTERHCSCLGRRR